MTGEVMAFAAECTVFMCPSRLEFGIPVEGAADEEELTGMARYTIRAAGWTADFIGVLCPAHRANAIGREK